MHVLMIRLSFVSANAATAVPWAIVLAIGIAGILGTAILIVLAFCMGTDLDAIVNNPIGQPMATIFFGAFGEKGTLGVWSVVVIVQWMMGSSMVRCLVTRCMYARKCQTLI